MELQTLLPVQSATTTSSIIMTLPVPIRVFLLSGHRLLREALARALKNQASIALVGAQKPSLNTTVDIIKSTCDVLLVDPANASASNRLVLDRSQNAISNLRIVTIEREATIADTISAILSASHAYEESQAGARFCKS